MEKNSGRLQLTIERIPIILLVKFVIWWIEIKIFLEVEDICGNSGKKIHSSD